jgi:hypothetical protein
MQVRDVREDALLVSEPRAKSDKRKTHFLESGRIPLCCLGLHPIHERHPSLRFIHESARILNQDWALLSLLAWIPLSGP